MPWVSYPHLLPAWGTGGPGGFTVRARTPARASLPNRPLIKRQQQNHPRARKAVLARRETGPSTAWTRVVIVLTVVAAVLNFGAATLHALPQAPSEKGIVVIIYAPSRQATCDRPRARHRALPDRGQAPQARGTA